MSALAWGTDAGRRVRRAHRVPRQRPHLVVLPGRSAESQDRGDCASPAGVAWRSWPWSWRSRQHSVSSGLRSAGAAEPARVVTVDTGQTLSEIAAAELPDHSISAGIVAIQLANGLSTAQVSAGQQLVIPGG